MVSSSFSTSAIPFPPATAISLAKPLHSQTSSIYAAEIHKTQELTPSTYTLTQSSLQRSSSAPSMSQGQSLASPCRSTKCGKTTTHSIQASLASSLVSMSSANSTVDAPGEATQLTRLLVITSATCGAFAFSALIVVSFLLVVRQKRKNW